MMRIIKAIYWILISCIISLALSIALLYLFTDHKMLNPEELIQLKENRTFWEWNSPFGKLNMHYIEKGTGNNHVLLLHPFRSHTFTWRYLIDPLEQAGYHVWAIDLIGYGLSDKPENVVYNRDFFANQVNSFMQHKKISQAHLIGNSMGGGLALTLALSNPQQVSSLSLLNALGYPLELPLHLSIGRYLSQLWSPFLGPKFVRSTLKKVVFDPDKVSDEQVKAYCLPYQFPGGIKASLSTLQQFDNQRLLEMSKQYHTLSCPVLIIWGKEDSLIPLTHYKQFLIDFPRAKSLLIPNCGHIPQEEAPENVLKTILSFLKEIDI